MFLTYPKFRQVLPPSLYGLGKEGHHAVGISTHLPWFLFSFMQVCEDGCYPQTVAVATEMTLLDLVKAVPAEQRLDVFCMTAGDSGGSWSLRQVEELWLPAPMEAEAGPLLFKFDDSPSLRDAFLSPFDEIKGRSLIYRAESKND
jgi:hypothetical protein